MRGCRPENAAPRSLCGGGAISLGFSLLAASGVRFPPSCFRVTFIQRTPSTCPPPRNTPPAGGAVPRLDAGGGQLRGLPDAGGRGRR